MFRSEVPMLPDHPQVWLGRRDIYTCLASKPACGIGLILIGKG